MSRRKVLALAVFILLVISAMFVVSMSLPGKKAESTGSGPDAPPYGQRGPHPVGIRDLVIDTETPLEITVWYPVLVREGIEETITYP